MVVARVTSAADYAAFAVKMTMSNQTIVIVKPSYVNVVVVHVQYAVYTSITGHEKVRPVKSDHCLVECHANTGKSW